MTPSKKHKKDLFREKKVDFQKRVHEIRVRDVLWPGAGFIYVLLGHVYDSKMCISILCRITHLVCYVRTHHLHVFESDAFC